MNRDDPQFEKNIGRLVHAAHGPGARLDPAARARTLRLLSAALRGAAGFPDRALIALAGALALMAIFLGTAGTGGVTGFVVVLLLALNLATVPVAGIVIVFLRRHHVSP